MFDFNAIDPVADTLLPMVVTWIDSEQPSSDWEWVDDVDKRGCLTIISVGFYVYHNEDTLGMSISRCKAKSGKAMVSGLLRIPRVAIRNIGWVKLDA